MELRHQNASALGREERTKDGGGNERWRGTTKDGRRRIMMVCGEGCRTIGEMVEALDLEGTFQTVTTLNQFKKSVAATLV